MLLRLGQDVKSFPNFNAIFWRMYALLEIGDVQAWDVDMDTYARFGTAARSAGLSRSAGHGGTTHTMTGA